MPKGFSLIETLVVVGMLALLASVSMVVGVQAFSRSSVKDDRDLLVGVLQKARSEAMHDVCTTEGCVGPSAFGVHINSREIVLFEGTSYNPQDSHSESFVAESAATHFSGTSNIVFAATSGDAASTSITVSNGTEVVSTVTIGTLGQISWSY